MARAIRRHHRERLKRKRAGYWGIGTKSPRQAGIVLRTPTPCSCWMCGNRRAHEGPTAKERIGGIDDAGDSA